MATLSRREQQVSCGEPLLRMWAAGKSFSHNARAFGHPPSSRSTIV